MGENEGDKDLQCGSWPMSYLASRKGVHADTPSHKPEGFLRLLSIFFPFRPSPYTSAQVNSSHCWVANIHKLFLPATIDANRGLCHCRWESTGHQARNGHHKDTFALILGKQVNSSVCDKCKTSWNPLSLTGVSQAISHVSGFCKLVILPSALHAYTGHALFWKT